MEWEYLFDVLNRFVLGAGFVEWVKVLYKSPAARVLVNGSVSEMFPLCRGTRRGATAYFLGGMQTHSSPPPLA